MTIDVIIGARPNFVKAFPLILTFDKERIDYRIIHTGQHYDYDMSKVFLDEFKFKDKLLFLNTKNKNPMSFISECINSYCKIIKNKKPKLCIVFGDVNSTLAISLVANKQQIPLAHIEAGLRSFDKSMPEENNRILTDHLSDFLFVTTENAKKNLLKENIKKNKIFHVGNIMIESLILTNIKRNKLKKKNIIITIHRPSNTENIQKVKKYLEILCENLNTNVEIIFPIHHSLKDKLNKYDKIFQRINFIKPLSYFNFINLLSSSIGVITDSGGISEETTFLNIPCITLRSNTERPETISKGTNILIGDDYKKFSKFLKKMSDENWKQAKSIRYWDSQVSKRIVNILRNNFIV